jgi:TRAP-type mannitol/chloroaromatic compound transport system substrate-binding protein
MCFVAAVMLSCVFLFAGIGSTQEKEVTLRFSTFFPTTHQNAKITEESCKEVEKRTNGKVKARQSAAETTFVYIKMALADYAASIERLLGISVDKARTRSSARIRTLISPCTR